MIIRTSHLYILGVSNFIAPLLAETRINVTVGSRAKLSCTFKTVRHYTPHILWAFNHKEVFERKGGSCIVGDGYEGRVDVPEENLRNGDCTLVLRNVSSNDAGEYESVLNFRRRKRSAIAETLIQRVTLVVEEVPEPPKEAPVPPNNDGREGRESSNDAGRNPTHPLIAISLIFIFTFPRVNILNF